MSFRKRNIKPNLTGTKRAKTSTSDEVATVEAEKPTKAEDTSHTEINLKESLVADDHLRTPLPPELNNETKLTSSKKLARRTKVAPKLSTRSTRSNVPSSINDTRSNVPSSINTPPISKLKTDTENIKHDTVSLTSEQKSSSTDVTNNELKQSSSTDIANNELKQSSSTDIANNELELSVGKDELVENSPSIDHPSTKRSSVDKGDSMVTGCNISSELPEMENLTKGKRLMKRKKISPKLSERVVKPSEQYVQNSICTDVNSDDIRESQDPSSNIQKDADHNISNHIQQEQCTEIPNDVVKTTDEVSDNPKHQKPPERHVHFHDEHVVENSLHILSQVCLVEASHRQEQLTRDGKRVDETSLKLDHNDDRISQSDSEVSTSLNLSTKRKAFKPNLGQRRRKRLSSFSAYSSCDEDNDDVTSKKKQATSVKVSDKSSNIEQDTKTGPSKGKQKKKKVGKKRKKEKENDQIENLSGEESVEKTKKSVKKRSEKCSAERELSSLTMQELIYYKPKSFVKVELRSKKEPVEDGSVREIASVDQNINESKVEDKHCVKELDENVNEDRDVVAPQVMVNEDGEIVINEESLTLKKKIDDSALKNSSVLYEDALSCGNNYRRKSNRGKRWKIEETLRFYKALSQIGTDFTLMSQAFGTFTRNELKKKFKQEEKINCDLVDRALANRLPLNMEMFLRGKEELRDFLEAETQSLSSPQPTEKSIEEEEGSLPPSEDCNEPEENIDDVNGADNVKMVDPT